ncbi:transglutaminase-like cysteine peptidase [Vibrio breoganii]|uniref:Sulfate adenylyltransferase n=1 Tax=Vibrio breoganii TaxID=553239 RepID=A0AAN1CT13_9VIBR|nr:transglutaminase-like cysteine peptidase [Vibrio breoganii]ANO34143.1 sulfate adenylyltransferase [Vibrio breoganii]PMG82047.1 sulfate adenylyltransferase [Vibrio breoganii]
MTRPLIISLLAGTLTFSVPALDKEELLWKSKVEAAYGERAGKRVVAWRNAVSDAAGKPELEQLKLINDFFNQFMFVDDIYLWGKKDYWATPMEFVGVGAGDCEDFTIAKYFSLLELGIDENKLRLIYGKAVELNQFHMVVAYYPTPNSVPLVLDNLDFRILPASQRPDIVPIYSFNGDHLWLAKESIQGKVAGKSSRLSLWNQVRERQKKLVLNQPLVNLDE